MTVYQCCYTNTGQDTGSQAQAGWHPVAVSASIPVQAQKFCVQAQNAVGANPSRKRGGVKGLYEILCDGAYVYVIYTTFGLTDNLGRANLFSHAFIFLGREVLNNPDSFLSLSRENFKKSEKEALKWDGNYESLIRDPPMTLEQARKLAGAESPEAYRSLICCAYAQMVKNGAEPLFVSYDAPKDGVTEADANRQIRALLHCVWWGLPLFLRRKFSAVSSPGLGGRDFNVVLTKSRKPKPGLWNPNGQNEGILTPQMKSRIQRYFYLQHAMELADKAENLSAYYDWLDKKAAECGDSSDETLLRLLSLQHWRKPDGADYVKNSESLCAPAQFSDDKLIDWLYDAQRMPSFSSQEGHYIKEIQNECKRRGLPLPEGISSATKQPNTPGGASGAKPTPSKPGGGDSQKPTPTAGTETHSTARNGGSGTTSTPTADTETEEEREERRRKDQKELEDRRRKDQKEIEDRRHKDKEEIEDRRRKEAQNAATIKWQTDGDQTRLENAQGALVYRVFTPSEKWTDDKTAQLSQTGRSYHKTLKNMLISDTLTMEWLNNTWQEYAQSAFTDELPAMRRLFLLHGWALYVENIRHRNNSKDAENYHAYADFARMVWDKPDDAIFDAKLAYWDLDCLPVNQTLSAYSNPPKDKRGLGLSLFSFDKADFYLEISEGIAHPNAQLFREFAQLGKNCLATERDNRNETQLKDIHAFFAQHSAISQNASETLNKCLSDNGSHTLRWYQSWTKLMIALGPISDDELQIRDGLILIYRALSTPDCPTLRERVPPMLELLKNRQPYGGGAGGATDCKALFVDTLKSACLEFDAKRPNGTPLDMWLLLGEARYGQSLCFDVFSAARYGVPDGDGCKAKVLKRPAKDVTGESQLLKSPKDDKKPNYVNYLVKHFKNLPLEDTHKKAVRNWLKALGVQHIK